MSIAKFIADRACPVCPPRARRKEARPGELLEAALDLFVEKGFAATRVEEVARRAGVSKGTLFLYFSSKEELFKEVVRKNLSAQFPQWNAQIDTFPGDTPDMLREFSRQWWERVGSTKASGLTKLIMSEAGNFPEIAEFYQHEVIEPGNILIRRILQRGVDRGEFRPLDMDYAPYGLLAPMIYLMMWKHSLGACASLQASCNLNPQQFLSQLVEMLLQGLCAPASRASLPSTERAPQ
jgi:TetR/AcrR family transcriptional regulator